MAEVLGVIASGIAVEQFAESVLKLKRLCSAVRNAPEEVKLLAEELDVIAALLVEVDGQRQQPYHTASSATTWDRCVIACKNARNASEDVIKELEKKLKTNRTLGGIRVAFKKEAIVELKSRLERAKSTLVLAQQTYFRWVFPGQKNGLNTSTNQNLEVLASIMFSKHSRLSYRTSGAC